LCWNGRSEERKSIFANRAATGNHKKNNVLASHFAKFRLDDSLTIYFAAFVSNSPTTIHVKEIMEQQQQQHRSDNEPFVTKATQSLRPGKPSKPTGLAAT
jgi:hypothetical protein